MVLNTSEPAAAASRFARWLVRPTACAFLAGETGRLELRVRLASGRVLRTAYAVRAVLDAETGQAAAWHLEGERGYFVTFGSECCTCDAFRYGRGPCKHIDGLRAALAAAGITY